MKFLPLTLCLFASPFAWCGHPKASEERPLPTAYVWHGQAQSQDPATGNATQLVRKSVEDILAWRKANWPRMEAMGDSEKRSFANAGMQALRSPVLAALEKETNPVLRQAHLLQLLLFPEVEEYQGNRCKSHFVPADLGERVMRDVPAGSPLWGELGYEATVLVRVPEGGAFVESLVSENPHPYFAGKRALRRLAKAEASGDAAGIQAAQAELERDYPSLAAERREDLGQTLKPELGKVPPNFHIQPVEAKGKPFTLAALRGKYVLVDWWSIGCGPCIGEIPNLEAQHKRFAAEGLEVLSLSPDKPEHIRKFRKGKGHAMPWKHGYLTEAVQKSLDATWALVYFPKPVLLGPDGTVLALDMDLRGGNLAKTLEKFLGKPTGK